MSCVSRESFDDFDIKEWLSDHKMILFVLALLVLAIASKIAEERAVSVNNLPRGVNNGHHIDVLITCRSNACLTCIGSILSGASSSHSLTIHAYVLCGKHNLHLASAFPHEKQRLRCYETLDEMGDAEQSDFALAMALYARLSTNPVKKHFVMIADEKLLFEKRWDLRLVSSYNESLAEFGDEGLLVVTACPPGYDSKDAMGTFPAIVEVKNDGRRALELAPRPLRSTSDSESARVPFACPALVFSEPAYFDVVCAACVRKAVAKAAEPESDCALVNRASISCHSDAVFVTPTCLFCRRVAPTAGVGADGMEKLFAREVLFTGLCAKNLDREAIQKYGSRAEAQRRIARYKGNTAN